MTTPRDEILMRHAHKIIGVSMRRVRTFIAAGRLRGRRDPVTGWWWLDRAQVEEFAAQKRHGGRPKKSPPR